MEMSKWERIREEINTFFTYPFVHLIYVYETKIRPRKVPHYWCKFYDPYDGVEKEGWYILDRKGKMIPWVHFDNGKMICLYYRDITPTTKISYPNWKS